MLIVSVVVSAILWLFRRYIPANIAPVQDHATANLGTTRRQVAAIGRARGKLVSRKADAIAALQAGLDLGLTHIDTAEMCGSGASEQIVGEAIRAARRGFPGLKGPAQQRLQPRHGARL
jgi:hypothetical protein